MHTWQNNNNSNFIQQTQERKFYGPGKADVYTEFSLHCPAVC